MNVIDSLASPKIEQLIAIFDERKRFNKEFGPASDKARLAAYHLQKATWSIHSMAYVNSLLRGISNCRLKDSYITIVLISTVEGFSFGQIGMLGLTYLEYNIAIGPVASVLAPELFQAAQNWKVEAIPASSYEIPYHPPEFGKGRSRRETDLDPYDELGELGIQEKTLKKAMELFAAPQPVLTGTTNVNRAMAKMMQGMRKATPEPEPVPTPTSNARTLSAAERMREAMRKQRSQ